MATDVYIFSSGVALMKIQQKYYNKLVPNFLATFTDFPLASLRVPKFVGNK
jgi:hypothetical protein